MKEWSVVTTASRTLGMVCLKKGKRVGESDDSGNLYGTLIQRFALACKDKSRNIRKGVIRQDRNHLLVSDELSYHARKYHKRQGGNDEPKRSITAPTLELRSSFMVERQRHKTRKM